MLSHDLFSGQFPVLVLVELSVETRGGGGRGPERLTLHEELQTIVALHLTERTVMEVNMQRRSHY